MDEKTYSLTIFLMKEHVTEFSQCVKREKSVREIPLKESCKFEGTILIADSSIRKPEWVSFLENYSEGEIELDHNISNKAILLVKVRNRIMALTFGYGRSILREENIVRNFGFMAALNMIDTSKIRNINAATIEDMVVHTQKQSSYATSQEEFSLNVFNDIITSISGQALNVTWANRISGNDSLFVSVSMFPDDLEEKLLRYLDFYENDSYKEKGFEWVDNIREIKDKTLVGSLETILFDKLKAKDLKNIYLTPPEVIDWSEYKGFTISGNSKRHLENPENFTDEFQFEEYLSKFGEDVDWKAKIKRDKIWGMDLEDECKSISNVYAAIVAQVEYSGELYILCDTRWYKIDTSFHNQVTEFVAGIPISNIDFPNCEAADHEETYNAKLAENPRYALMDQKLVGVENGPRQIEACDVFTADKQFIHLKNRHSSAQLSHLFAQGRVSAESFVSDQEFRKQVYDKVKEKLGSQVFDYRNKPASEEFEVIYGIIDRSVEPNVMDLPFFSLVNLMLSAKELGRMHMRCSVKMIKKDEVR